MANYRIRMKANKTAEVLIYDDIGEGWFGGISAKTFAEELRALGAGIETLNIRINSPGGDVFDGLAIYNTLRRYQAQKNVSIDGMALSIASVIALAGDKVSMAENAMFMIHDPWGVVMGTAEDMRKQGDLMDTVKENLVSTYERRVVQTLGAAPNGEDYGERIREMMSAETWMTASQAVEEGFIDEVTADMAMAAHFDPKRFKNVPPGLRAKIKAQPTPRSDLVRARLLDLRQRALNT